MELIRRDTDYAFRLAAILTRVYGTERTISAKALAKEAQVSYALTGKILQKLAYAGIVESMMGSKGGWKLIKAPDEVQFAHVIEAVQGPIAVNRCLLSEHRCPLMGQCPAHPKMVQLQDQVAGFLQELTLKEFVSVEKDGQ